MTAKYPVSANDQEGIVDAVNYLLSGPAGLGQNYAGFSSFAPTYIRPTVRQPFTLPIDTTLVTLWSFDWPISNITVVGTNPSRFIEVTFSVTAPAITITAPPFQFGDRLSLSGVTPSFYDGNYNVVSSTPTTVILSTSRDYTWPAYTSGGSLVRDFYDFPVSTDCNARVTVLGPSDQVFVSGFLELEESFYDSRTPTVPVINPSVESAWEILIQINRYRGTPTDNQNDNDFVFSDPVTVAQFSVPRDTGTTNSGLIFDFPLIEVPAFVSILDKPSFGYYWYILEVNWKTIDISRGQPATVSIKSGTGAGVPGTYTNVPGYGPNNAFVPICNFDVVLTAATSEPYTTANTTITVIPTVPTPGLNVLNIDKGDPIIIRGADLGGATPANNLTLTADTVNGYGPIRPAQQKAKLRSLSAQVIKQ